jgi:hypothetical protein
MSERIDPGPIARAGLRLDAGLKASGTSPIEPVHTFETGAQRSEVKPRYDLIPNSGLVRLAARFEMGLKYGEHNYKLGLPFDDTFNHIIEHLEKYKERRKEFLREVSEGDVRDFGGVSKETAAIHVTRGRETDGDDLAAAAWGCFALMELERTERLK